MLIHYPGVPPLSDYGIGIPVADNRAPKCLEYLTGLPGIGDRLPSLLITEPDRVIGKADVSRVHEPAHTARVFGEERKAALMEAFELVDELGAYNRYNPDAAVRDLNDLMDTILIRASGSFRCAETALETGFCFYFGGGFHHAHPGFGHGFCIVNDIMIAAARLIAEKRASTVWVIDVDAHKGDGTAAIAANRPDVRTLSIHMGSGWPLDRLEYLPDGTRHPSFIPSDIDIPVFEGEEASYNERLSEGLAQLDRYIKPELAIVVSGSDPYEKDTLPSTAGLNLTLEQMAERDRIVYQFLRDRRIPAAYLMAGGYSPESWRVYANLLEMALSDRLRDGRT